MSKMYLSHCFAYTHITAEIRQQQDCVVMELKDENRTDLQVTLSYLQAKTLAEGLSAVTNQASLTEVLATKCGFILGDMTVHFVLPIEKENQQEGEEQKCRQNILPAPTAELSLSKSA
ncbi:MAG: hypothetical protein ABFC57_04460 [Veillonellales bacterium]